MVLSNITDQSIRITGTYPATYDSLFVFLYISFEVFSVQQLIPKLNV